MTASSPIAEIEDRIARFHRPYHDELEAMLTELHARFGGVWHINAHSMKALGRKQGKSIPRDDFVLGDLEGESCDPEFTAFVAETLAGLWLFGAHQPSLQGRRSGEAVRPPARKAGTACRSRSIAASTWTKTRSRRPAASTR